MTKLFIRIIRLSCPLLLMVCLTSAGRAYSVLTHEEIVDLVWNSEIQPLLLERFPGSSDDALREAHAYAYGGAVIQDLGYYPFGTDFFSDLLHYVRSGVLVQNLIAEASNLNEYAFALGALAHYASDITGHPAVNRAVSVEYPALRKKYGPVVTYEQGKHEHLKTEFGFDVAQVAEHRYAPQSYHDFIGFEVSKDVLERAFFDTYRVPLNTVLKHEDLAIGTYRRSISKVIPGMTRVALAMRKKEIAREYPNFSKRQFLYNLSRAEYQKQWGTVYEKPGTGARVLAFVLQLVPKVGPLRGLAYKDPTPQTEDLYFKSVNSTVVYYSTLLQEVRGRTLSLPDVDLDTGDKTRPGEYELADQTYAMLLDRLSQNDFTGVDRVLQQSLVEFLGSDSVKIADQQTRQAMIGELVLLRLTEPAVSSLLVKKSK